MRAKSSSTSLTRVLVLEENAEWREALAGMYRSILGHRGEVIVASDTAVAERQLKRQPVDVLSLDLNLSEGRAGSEGPLLCDTGRLQLIEVAAKRRWAAGVILITRSEAEDGDGRSRDSSPADEEKLNEATVSPDEFVRRRFDERGLVLNKPARWDLPTTISRFEELIRRRLPDLARPGYTLQFGGTTYEPRVYDQSRPGSRGRPWKSSDAMLLAMLVIAGRAGELLSDRSILETAAAAARQVRLTPRRRRVWPKARSTEFRCCLRRQGVNDRALVHRVRKTGLGDHAAGLPGASGAWRIDGAVASEGTSSLNVRGRGGHGFRPDVPAPGE